MSITARRIIMFAGLVLLIGAFALSRFLSNQKQPPRPKVAGTKVKMVDTMHVRLGSIPTTLNVQGELSAYDKIDLFSEVTGTLEKTERSFKVGTYFPKGALLIKVNQEEAKLSLLSQKSNLLNAITQLMPDLKIDYPESYEHWKDYLDNFEVEAPIKAFPEALNDQEKYFIASRNLYSQYYTIKSQEERLDKYTLYAPFSGVITAASINPGAVVRAGQKLGELMSTGSYELEATVALRDLKYLAVGNPVELYSEDIEGSWNGKIRRISDQVDAGTQTVRVFIAVNGNDLKENMYLRGDVVASSIDNAFALPRNLLNDQRGVFVVQDSILRMEEVQVVKMTDESAIIRGLKDGTPILAQPIPDAFDGMKVRISTQQKSKNAQSAKTGPKDQLGSAE
ncbi:efflux RND transporter periplasmic adaptor subunit [Phaeodactylibacter xiamenensis]|uniref:efflux RND transporter periplasmic adaptor subunit n=1 Tax=Phaeodactylibacter xiamenensis TaxID=1524460 RepID=UPI003BAD89E8